MQAVAEQAGAAGQEDPFAGLYLSLGNYGELQKLLKGVAKAAPDEIRADAEAVRDAWAGQGDLVGQSASDPVGALAAGLFAMATVGPSMEAIDRFTDAHCGITIFAPVPEPMPGSP